MILQFHQILSCVDLECDGLVMGLTFLTNLQKTEWKVVPERLEKIDNVVKHHGFLMYEHESPAYKYVAAHINDWK